MVDELVQGLSITAISLVIAIILTLLVDKLFKKKYPLVRLLLAASIWAVAIIFSLSAIGLRTDILLVLVAIIGFVIAWSLKPLMASFLVQQTYLPSAKPIKIGDVITMDDLSGRVVATGPFNTTLALQNGNLALLPNFRLAEESVVVGTHENAVATIDLLITLDELKRVQSTLPDIATEFRSSLTENTKPRLQVKEIIEGRLRIKLELSVKNPNLADRVMNDFIMKLIETPDILTHKP